MWCGSQLREETGYHAEAVLESSPVIVSDPGMTNANMHLVIVSVVLEDKMEKPKAQLEAGEFIETRVVELSLVQSKLSSHTCSVVESDLDSSIANSKVCVEVLSHSDAK